LLRVLFILKSSFAEDYNVNNLMTRYSRHQKKTTKKPTNKTKAFDQVSQKRIALKHIFCYFLK
jgi:hypothetical protein